MGAMDRDKSGTTARDGLLGGVDRADAVGVGVGADRRGGSLGSNAEQLQNLRHRRHRAGDRPGRDLIDGQAQHLGQVGVGAEPELVEQLLLGHRREVSGRAEDLRAEFMPGDPRGAFDAERLSRRDAGSGLPVADGALANTKGNGEGSHATSGFYGFVESVHARSITYRDPSSNTNRVSAASHTVKNPGMAFSDNLRAARIKAGMTQEALALACGWSGQSRIANYESSAASAREPKVSEVPLLANALGVSIASLFGEAPASHSPRPAPAILAETHRFLDKAFGTLGKAFDIETDADLFADVYEWILTDERPADQRNLVDFAAWREKRDLHRGTATHEQNGRAAAQADGADKRRA